MKIYISADIEGVTGSTHTDEATKSSPEYSEFQKQMTDEVIAACQGAIDAGAKEIYIKDAHSTGRNIIANKLPECTKLIRGWSRHPFGMLQELDETFHAVIMIGYHARAGSGANPLSHTFNNNISLMKINGKLASEFLCNAYTAAFQNVPIVFVSGDEGTCEEVKNFNEKIATVAVKRGIGASTINIHPHLALKRIEQEVKNILSRDITKLKINIPKSFKVEIEFRSHTLAYNASFYPGVQQIGSKSILYETTNYFDVLRMFMFAI